MDIHQEITDEEIDQLLADVTEECGDGNDFDIGPDFDDVIESLGAANAVSSVTQVQKQDVTSGQIPEKHQISAGDDQQCEFAESRASCQEEKIRVNATKEQPSKTLSEKENVKAKSEMEGDMGNIASGDKQTDASVHTGKVEADISKPVTSDDTKQGQAGDRESYKDSAGKKGKVADSTETDVTEKKSSSSGESVVNTVLVPETGKKKTKKQEDVSQILPNTKTLEEDNVALLVKHDAKSAGKTGSKEMFRDSASATDFAGIGLKKLEGVAGKLEHEAKRPTVNSEEGGIEVKPLTSTVAVDDERRKEISQGTMQETKGQPDRSERKEEEEKPNKDLPKDTTEDGKESKEKKKVGGWGWKSFGSWGSSVLNQVGDSLYHVLETVESSLVEPETPSQNVSDEAGLASREEDDEMERVESTGVLDVTRTHVGVKEQDRQGQQEKIRQVGLEEKLGDKDEAAAAADVDLKTNTVGGRVAKDDAKRIDADKDEREKSSSADDQGKRRSSREKGQQQSWFSGWGLSTITGAVQQTSKKVIGTGFDVLENLSKKTQGLLADDPEEDVLPLSPSAASSSPPPSSPKKKAKKSSSKDRDRTKAQMLRKCFDDCQGLAHFDALNDLSQVSQEKLNVQLDSFAGERLTAVKTDLLLIRDASDLGGMDWEVNFGNAEHDFCQLVKDFISQLNTSVSLQKLFNVQETTSKWVSSCLLENSRDKKFSAEDIHKMAILMLADFTATGVAQFHKIAQLLLVDFSTPLLSYKFRALSLAGFTKVLCTEIWIEARRFTECLNQPELMESPDVVVSLITNLTLEASNCSSCLQDAYHLLLPIIQLAALKVHPMTSDSSDVPNLEVLQLMAGMSQAKVSKIVNQLSGDSRRSVQDDLSAVEAAFDQTFIATDCESDNLSHDFSRLVLQSLVQIGVDISTQKLLQTQEQIRKRLTSFQQRSSSDTTTPSDIHQKALKSLDELTVCAVELFHQIAQVILLENPREIAAYIKRASGIRDLAKALSLEVGYLSTKFTSCLFSASPIRGDAKPEETSSDSDVDVVTPFITNVYLEASNSTTYIQDSFLLLLPIMQLALVKAHPTCAGLGD